MGKLIQLKVDVSKITKDRLYVGEKGTYLDLTVSLNDQADNYGNNVSCWEGQTKPEREAKKNRNFLGNGRVTYDSQAPAPQAPANDGFGSAPADDTDELPF